MESTAVRVRFWPRAVAKALWRVGDNLYTLPDPIEQTCWLLAKRFEAGVR